MKSTKMTLMIALSGVGSLGLLGCESVATPSAEPRVVESTATTASASPATSNSAGTNGEPSPAVAIKPGGDPALAVAGSNGFGLALYKQISAGDGNFVFSSASISLAMAMTAAGARGPTLTGIQKALQFPESKTLNSGWATLAHRLTTAKSVEFGVANRIFSDKRYTLESAFVSTARESYGAPIEQLDFAAAPEQQRKFINDWVANQTRKRITDLIPEGGVSSATRMALVNAIYFKGQWATAFTAAATKKDSFSAPGGAMDVHMMSQTGSLPYAEVDGVQLVDRPYKNREFSTLFVLPKAGEQLADLESKLSTKLMTSWVDALETSNVAMQLPRFEVKPASPIELSAQLQKMGAGLAFDRNKADFTGITNPTAKADRLFIEKVFHKAFIAVDEKGTEAAAATAVMMGRLGGMGDDSPPKTFRADRPFLFFVRDNKTGLVLFGGRVTLPTAFKAAK